VWIEFETEADGAIYVRIDRKRKFPATSLLRIFADTTSLDVNNATSSSHSVSITGGTCPSGYITGTQYVSDMECVVSDNIIVQNGGSLTLDNVVLKMNPATDLQYGIIVESGGAMYVKGGSKIMSNNPSNRFFFRVLEGAADFEFTDSYLSDCGLIATGYMDDGLYIEADNVVEIRNSTFYNNAEGIVLYMANNNYFTDNTLYDNDRTGFVSWSSTKNTITGNNLYDNGLYDDYGRDLRIEGPLAIYHDNVVEDNLVDGLPAYYFFNQDGVVFDGAVTPTKHITLGNCTNMTIKNINMNGGDGIVLRSTSDSEVYNNTMIDTVTEYGISVFYGSSNNKIHDNTITATRYNIYVRGPGSHNNEVYNNLLGNTTGVAFEARDADNVWVHDNTVKGISYGSSIEFGIWLRLTNNSIVENNYVEGLSAPDCIQLPSSHRCLP